MKSLVVANWKMNPKTLTEAKKLFVSVKKGIKNVKNVEVVICPPFVYLTVLRANGAQDCFWEDPPAGGGAYTGEISPAMLKKIGCKYIIIGHSERRRHQKETDEMINKKLKVVLKTGLKPILCVGSMKRGAEGNREMKSQLKKALVGVKKANLKNIIFTYEPIWAISTTKGSIIATPQNTKNGKIFIRKVIAKLFSKAFAQKVRIIYGGSVDSQNIEGFIKEAQMDGALVGAASLRPNDFIGAVKKVDLISKI